MATTQTYTSRHQGPAAADLKFSERDFALYESIIVKNKGQGSLTKLTKAVDRLNLSEDPTKTWAERGLPEPKVI